MVKGIERFRDHFRGLEDSFVIIGGVACDQWINMQGLHFRATKDVDIVLLAEQDPDNFAKRLWEFIREGQYENRQRAEEKSQFYRFSRPAVKDFPAMIELFSRTPDTIKLATGQEITPIPVGDDISSLSAILLDPAYYSFIRDNRETHDGLPYIKREALIPLKAKAWLDLRRRKAEGQRVDESDIKKHRNDAFLLATTLAADSRLSSPDQIRADLREFLGAFPEDNAEWKTVQSSLKNTNNLSVNRFELAGVMQTCFAL